MRLDFAIDACHQTRNVVHGNRFGCIAQVHRHVEGMTSQIHQHSATAGAGIIIETGIGSGLGGERTLGNGDGAQRTKPILRYESSGKDHGP